MKRSKKGITLVELVICCAVIVLIGGAATALLMSGEHLFSSSADSASNQMELDVLQSYVMGIIPSAKNIGVVETDGDGNLKLPESGNSIYFKDDGTLIIRTGTKETEIRSVKEFKYQVVRAGVAPAPTAEAGAEAEPDTARAQFLYTVTFKSGHTYQGGFVINNLSYPVVSTSIGSNLVSLSDAPLYVSIPEPPTEPTT